MVQAETTKQVPVVTDEIATASKDIDIFAGWLKRLENPDPTLRTEAGGKGLKLYDEVDRDPHAGAVLQSRYLAVISKEWEVLPGEETAGTKAQDMADFVRVTLEGTNFDQMRQELLQAILYGFYVSEVMWTVKNSQIVPLKIRAKHPRRFSFSLDRELRLLTLANMIDGEPIPDCKFIRFTYGSSDNPYGKGLGQKLWWPVWFKKNGIKFWLMFLEKFGMPTIVGKYPPGTPVPQQKALLDAIDAIQNETGVKIPDSMAIELLEATRTGQVTHESLCEYMDKQISKAVLGQTATTEGTPGKLGNEDSQEKTRQDVVEADAGLMDECLNGSIVKWIVDYNFPAGTAYPKIHTRTEQEKDLKPLAERDKTLAKDIGLPVGRKYFYKTYNVPEPEKGEELVQVAGGRETAASFSVIPAKAGIQTDQGLSPADTLDALGEKTLAAADMKGLLCPVEDLLSSVNSLGEFRDRLAELHDDMDEAALGDLMARALTLANISGRFDAGER